MRSSKETGRKIGRGIGRGISEALGREGATVLINYRKDKEAAEETAKWLNQSGKIVVVVELIEVMKSPNLDAQVKGFKAGLAKHPG